MTLISFKRHQLSPVINQHAVWLYIRFTLSFRDAEGVLSKLSIDVPNETVRRREPKQQRFKSPGSAHRFLSIHAAVYNVIYVQPHILSRRIFKEFRVNALAVWHQSWLAA
jgi:putative transposase